MRGIENYRAQNWRIARVSGRASAFFSLRHVLYPASGMRRRKHEMAHEKVCRMLDRLHTMWFTRVKSLLLRNLWQPGESLTRVGDLLTARRVMHCRPSCVYYAGGNMQKIRPCRRDKFCPFCWARVASAAYRHYKRQIRIARKTGKSLALYCRVVSQDLPATRLFSTPAFAQDLQTLRAAILRHASAYKALTKKLQRKTLGSAWRVVVCPTDTGWRLETRQLFLCPPTVAQPLVLLPESQEAAVQCLDLTDADAVLDVLGAFFEYPAGMLCSHEELAAGALNVTANLRLASGTGVFRAAGHGLSRHQQKETTRGADASGAAVQAYVPPDDVSNAVPVRGFVRR